MDGVTNRAERRMAARYLARENAKMPKFLVVIPPAEWPQAGLPGLKEVWRSQDYLVQVFTEPAPCIARLSVNLTRRAGNRWQDGIAWEDLQRLKAECGYGQYDAVEVYPHDLDVVNVANMRHLWIMAEPLSFAWRGK